MAILAILLEKLSKNHKIGDFGGKKLSKCDKNSNINNYSFVPQIEHPVALCDSVFKIRNLNNQRVAKVLLCCKNISNKWWSDALYQEYSNNLWLLNTWEDTKSQNREYVISNLYKFDYNSFESKDGAELSQMLNNGIIKEVKTEMSWLLTW